MAGVVVKNATRGQLVVAEGEVADGYLARMRGLIGHPPLSHGQGMLIVPCSSIHTHFMGFAIDVIYVGRAHQVLAFDEDLAPWRFGRLHRHVWYVIELPAGSVARTGTEVGDRLEVQGYTFPR